MTISLPHLPPEIISLIITHLGSLQDLRCLMLTCRAFRGIAASILASTLRRLARREYGRFASYMGLDPHIIVAYKTRQIADWAAQSDENKQALHQAVQSGKEAFLDLVLQLSPLTLDDLRRIHTFQRDVLVPLSKRYGRPGPAAKVGESDAYVLIGLVNLWVFGNLFHLNISSIYRPGTQNTLTDDTLQIWLENWLSSPISPHGEHDGLLATLLFFKNLVGRTFTEPTGHTVTVDELADACIVYFLVPTLAKLYVPGANFENTFKQAESRLRVLRAEIRQAWLMTEDDTQIQEAFAKVNLAAAIRRYIHACKWDAFVNLSTARRSSE